MVKRSGHAHGIGELLPLRPEGSVVVPCFACPEPGFNMAELCDMDNEEFRCVVLKYSDIDELGLMIKPLDICTNFICLATVILVFV